jgi:hypothetical protein
MLVAFLTEEADSGVVSTGPTDNYIIGSEFKVVSPRMLSKLPGPFGGCTPKEAGT